MEDLWSDIIPSIIGVPYKIYKRRYLIHHIYKRISVLLNAGNTNIVVVGRPSVGKTLLTKHLNGKITIQTDKPELSLDVEVDVLRLKKWSKIISTIPGQLMAEREQGLEKAFDRHDELEGVIYVVDWGYTKTWNKIAEKELISKGITDVNALREYNLETEREDFKHILAKIRQAISNNRGPKWLLIAVNKADLFYDEIDEAQKYYDPNFKSEFTDILNDFLDFVGRKNFKCISLPISCWEESLTWNTEIIETKLGGMDNKRALFLNFHKKLVELSN